MALKHDAAGGALGQSVSAPPVFAVADLKQEVADDDPCIAALQQNGSASVKDAADHPRFFAPSFNVERRYSDDLRRKQSLLFDIRTVASRGDE